MCNGQGTCGAYNKCSCFTGFTGADCSEKTCPTGKPWVDYATADDVARSTDVECSNMGLCDTFTGECVCPVGFEGPACERKSCPNNCNGHGQCLSMSEAAIEQDDRTLFATTTYTSIWDAEKIYGCVCDLGYTGADCSLRTCPVGDDPMTTGQVDEVQAISCLCNGCSGTFTVTFRGETTAPIETTATAATVEATLEALRTIDDITVAFDGGSTICDTDGVSAMITFTQNPGNLPNLIITSSLTGGSSAVSVESDGSTAAYGSTPATVTGTKENVECSGRGTCDTSTGTCTCTTGFASSNGAGGTGTLGECGYNSATVTACPRKCCCC